MSGAGCSAGSAGWGRTWGASGYRSRCVPPSHSQSVDALVPCGPGRLPTPWLAAAWCLVHTRARTHTHTHSRGKGARPLRTLSAHSLSLTVRTASSSPNLSRPSRAASLRHVLTTGLYPLCPVLSLQMSTKVSDKHFAFHFQEVGKHKQTGSEPDKASVPGGSVCN